MTTKTAILGMTRAVAIETTTSGITCNAICPGTLPTLAIQEKIASIAASEGRSVDEFDPRLSGGTSADRAVWRHGRRRRDGGVAVQPRWPGHHRREPADRRGLVHRMSGHLRPFFFGADVCPINSQFSFQSISFLKRSRARQEAAMKVAGRFLLLLLLSPTLPASAQEYPSGRSPSSSHSRPVVPAT